MKPSPQTGEPEAAAKDGDMIKHSLLMNSIYQHADNHMRNCP